MKNHIIKRMLCLLICAVMLCMALPVSAEDAPDVTATNCAIYNIENNITTYAKAADDRIYPASTVKLLTGILAYEYFADKLDDEITVTSEALAYGTGGIGIGLRVGEIICVRELLYALILYNANDAASVLACNAAGSIPNFVRQMNEKAAALGCTDSFFTNPTGMDDDQMHTTVNDLVIIASYCAKNTGYIGFTSTQYHDIPATNISRERTVFNRNHMVSTYLYKSKYFDNLAKGMTSGATSKGGYCAVELFTWYGDNYVAVVMNAKYDADNDINYVYSDSKKLLKWTNAHYAYQKIADTKTMICELPVSMSRSADHISLVPEETVELYVPVDTDLSKEVDVSWRLFGQGLDAPVKKGEIAGIMTVKFKGKVVRTMKLVTKNELPESTLLRFLDAMKKIVTNPFFILLVLITLSVSVFVIVRTAKLRGRKLRRKNRMNT